MIEINGLTKVYRNKKGIFDVHFTVEEGEVFGFLGPNGAGKTTTIRQLMGFLKPDGGSASIGGLDCWKDAAAIQKNLGYLPGEIAFMEHMTGLQLIRFMAELRGMKDLGKADALIDRFELDTRGKIRKMSKGMKQKLGLVCAFFHDPAVLILDEPTSGLDPLMQNRFVELILEEKARGKTILMSSHMFEEVERTCGRVGIIKSGHLIAVEATTRLREAKSKRFAVTFASEEAAAAFRAEGFAVKAAEGATLQVKIKGELTPFLAALGRYPVENLETATQSLEEIFMHYYGEEGEDHVQ